MVFQLGSEYKLYVQASEFFCSRSIPFSKAAASEAEEEDEKKRDITPLPKSLESHFIPFAKASERATLLLLSPPIPFPISSTIKLPSLPTRILYPKYPSALSLQTRANSISKPLQSRALRAFPRTATEQLLCLRFFRAFLRQNGFAAALLVVKDLLAAAERLLRRFAAWNRGLEGWLSGAGSGGGLAGFFGVGV